MNEINISKIYKFYIFSSLVLSIIFAYILKSFNFFLFKDKF